MLFSLFLLSLFETKYSNKQFEQYDVSEWPSGLYSLRQVTEVKLGRVRSDFGWVTTEA